MELSPQIFTGKVMHKRLFPKENAFTYSIYYLALPLSKIDQAPKSFALSFQEEDHGHRDGSGLEYWIRSVLKKHNPALDSITEDIMLVCMPRIFGYVFNPVSFWMCLDKKKNIRAVLCEVNNTFGETHSYLCVQPGLKPISQDDWLEADKIFHVSPFLKREGEYKFRFASKGEKLGMWIDFYDAESKKQLITALTGSLSPMSKKTLRKAFWSHPLVTFKAITLIHWQALKLISKGIKHLKKPQQKDKRLSITKF